LTIQTPELKNDFNPLKVILPVAAILLLISSWIQWYSDEVSMPRYCEDPVHTLDHLEKVITESRPAGDNPRRPYLIAAKLLFLVPRQGDESLVSYLDRVELYLQETCQ
jgi:cytochrome b